VKIYTKNGDAGATSLIGGGRVPKNHPRVEAYGNVDEVIAHIGLVRAYVTDTATSGLLQQIQETLMVLSAHLANQGSHKKLPPLKEESIALLETSIDAIQEQLPPLSSFILPGPPLAAAFCQVARTVCRRAERSVVALGTEAAPPQTVTYLNRLSDFLFVLGRLIDLQKS